MFRSRQKGTLSKTRTNGEMLRYHQETKDGIPKTMFRPKKGIEY